MSKTLNDFIQEQLTNTDSLDKMTEFLMAQAEKLKENPSQIKVSEAMAEIGKVVVNGFTAKVAAANVMVNHKKIKKFNEQ